MSQKAQILTEHYQRTYELTLKMWEQRNTTFFLLIILVGISTLLTFQESLTEPLIRMILKTFTSPDPEGLETVTSHLTQGILHGIFMMIILFLLVILYHRNAYISRCYAYLAGIEPEIRNVLEIPNEEVAFTRESTFYQKFQSPYSKFVSLTYSGTLGCLLAAFLGGRLIMDFQVNIYLFIIDIFFSVLIIFFFIAYVKTS